jgi:hypothetical protein
MLLLVFGIFFGVRYAVHSFLAAYTDTVPMDLPEAKLSPGELEALDKRLAAFAEGLKSEETLDPLVLNPEEINAFISRLPDMKETRGRFYLELEGETVKGRISIPLERPDRAGEPSRYLNGTAVFQVGLTNGNLLVRLQSAHVKGKPLPGPLLEPFRRENLAREFLQNRPEAAEFFLDLESVEIQEGNVVLFPKPPGRR